MYRTVVRATDIAKSFVEKVVVDGDIVVDATLGNGNDSIFLSELTKKGLVYSFDIQESAIKSFEEKKIENVFLINDGHENIDKYVKGNPKCIMFNLGYLPGGDKTIKTNMETTERAFQKSLDILAKGGIITLISYIGHEGGLDENAAIEGIIKSLNPAEFAPMKIEYFSRNNNAPILYVIEKKGN